MDNHKSSGGNVISDEAFAPEYAYWELVPAGEYSVIYFHVEEVKVPASWGKRIALMFTIIEGEYEGFLLPRFINIQSGSRNFRFRKNSNYDLLYREVMGRSPARRDRISPIFLRDVPLIATVVDVTRHGDREKTPHQSGYSKIDRLRKPVCP